MKLFRCISLSTLPLCLAACAPPNDGAGAGAGRPIMLVDPLVECPACLTDTDCGSAAHCGQFGGDTFCAPACGGAGASCSSDRVCTEVNTAEGQLQQLCVPQSDICGVIPGDAAACAHALCTSGTKLASSCSPCAAKVCAADSYCCNTKWDSQCVGEVTSICQESCSGTGSSSSSSTGASSSSSGSSGTGSSSSGGGGTCAHSECSAGTKLALGCDPCVTKVCAADSYCCNTKWDSQCVTEVSTSCGSSTCSGGTGSSSSSSSSGTGSSSSSSSSGTGSSSSGGTGGGVNGITGGTLDTLRFVVVGDTRPATVDDTAGYPTAIITKIWQEVEARSPRPAFAVTTGDYMFATPGKGQASPQLDAYLNARATFTNLSFPAMGNHECSGYTASNCGTGNTDGVTENYTVFLQKMLSPLGVTKPYYTLTVGSTNNTWTAKFVFVAGNAWDSGQSAWFTAEMAKPTTYTFVVRHEGSNATTAPGVTPSGQIMSKSTYTLLLAGHTHTFSYSSSSREVIIGNGGAPLTGSINYGYLVGEQRSDGAIVFSEYDYSTNAVAQTFAVKADGTPTQ